MRLSCWFPFKTTNQVSLTKERSNSCVRSLVRPGVNRLFVACPDTSCVPVGTRPLIDRRCLLINLVSTMFDSTSLVVFLSDEPCPLDGLSYDHASIEQKAVVSEQALLASSIGH